MTIGDELKHAGMVEAGRLEVRAAHAQSELEQTKLRQLELNAIVESARLASKRARDFKPGLGPDYPCPRCFVVNEARSVMRPIPSQIAREDIFRCGTCGFELVITS